MHARNFKGHLHAHLFIELVLQCTMNRQIHKWPYSALFMHYKLCYSSNAVVQTAPLTGPAVRAGSTMMPCLIPAAWRRVRAVDRTRTKCAQRSAGTHNFSHFISFLWTYDRVFYDCVLIIRVVSGPSSCFCWKTWCGSVLSALLLDSLR